MGFGLRDTIRRLGNDIRYRLTSMAILLVGALFILGAAGIGIASLYIWLSTWMPNYSAALAISGGLFLIGTLFTAFAFARSSLLEVSEPAPQDFAESDPQMIAERMVQSVQGAIAVAPLKTVCGAVALGIIVGLVRAKKSS